MKKKLLALCLTLALLCGAGALAAGESYSFPAAGVFVEPAEGWQLFSPETLDAAGETLARLGADADVLRADWAAAGRRAGAAQLPGNGRSRRAGRRVVDDGRSARGLPRQLRPCAV